MSRGRDFSVSSRRVDTVGEYHPGKVGLHVRAMSEYDVASVMELRSEVRWFDDPEAFELLRGMRDARWTVAGGSDGRLAGMVGAVPLGDAGILCHLAVRGRYRGMGLGRDLSAWALSYLRSLGVRGVRLYSTPEAESLYTSLGFRRVGYRDAYRRESGTPGTARPVHPVHPVRDVSVLTFGDLPELYGVDLWNCGLDRSHVILSTLRMHPGRGLVSRDSTGRIRGYLVRSNSGDAVKLGPFLASDETVARSLMAAALADPDGRPVEISAAGDGQVRDLLGEFGFVGRPDKIAMEIGDIGGARTGGLHHYATTAYLST